MASRTLPWLVLPLLVVACSKQQSEPASSSAGGAIGAAPEATSPAPAAEPAGGAPAPYPGAGPAATAAAAPAGASLASQETNWQGVVADVVELQRKGNTLTAKVRFRNGGTDDRQVEVKFDEVYLMDAPNAKKYEVLRDEKGVYIAGLRSGWNDRWYDTLKASQTHLIWMKFPAPPPEVNTITLQLPNTPPFEDLAIQNG
jgi:hypothetical protein